MSPNQDEDLKKKIAELEEALKANGALLTEQEKTHEEKLEESKNKEITSNVDLSKPHIINLNEDQLLNGKVAFSLENEKTFVGTKKGEPKNDIVLAGMGIKGNHATLCNIEGNIWLEPNSVIK